MALESLVADDVMTENRVVDTESPEGGGITVGGEEVEAFSVSQLEGRCHCNAQAPPSIIQSGAGRVRAAGLPGDGAAEPSEEEESVGVGGGGVRESVTENVIE